MAFNLTTPFSLGDLAPGVTCPKAKILAFSLRTGPRARIHIEYEMGDEDADGNWIPVNLTRGNMMLSGEDYDNSVADNADLYAGVKAAAYAILVNAGILTGEVA